MRVSIRKYIGALCKITVYTVTNRKSNVIPCKKRKQWTVYNLRFERFLRKNVIIRFRFAPIWALLDERNRGGTEGGNPGPIRPIPSPSGPLNPQPAVDSRLSRSRTAAHAQNRRVRAHLSLFGRLTYTESRFAIHFLVDARRRCRYTVNRTERAGGYQPTNLVG